MIDAKLTPAVLKELDLLSLGELEDRYGKGRLSTSYHPGQGYWPPGSGRPVLTVEDPAAAQAAGRCAANRTRFGGIVPGVSIHPDRCGWCDYPLEELLAALDHASFLSRYVVSEYIRWEAKDGTYTRSTGRAGTYENPAWARFFSQDRGLRALAVEAARA